MTAPLLSIADLHVAMGPQEILHGVRLDVAQGAIVAVLGSNGVGKTTLMRTVSGIYRARQGSISFRGQPITNMPAHRIVQLGLSQAPEGRQIFSNMNVRENLVLGGGDVGLGELDRVLAMFPILSERLRQNAGSLSGGNVTPAAEFHVYVDPEAARIVFQSGIPVNMVGLDVTRRTELTEAHVRRLEAAGTAVHHFF